MRGRLDQVLYWLERGRVVVQVEYYDALGRLRKEVFHRPTSDFAAALEDVAHELQGRGIDGGARVRKRQGNSLTTVPELQRLFLSIVRED